VKPVAGLSIIALTPITRPARWTGAPPRAPGRIVTSSGMSPPRGRPPYGLAGAAAHRL
jgi:hypothetical protein